MPLKVGKVKVGPYCHAMNMRDGIEYGLFRTLVAGLRCCPKGLTVRALSALARHAVRHRWWRADVACRQVAASYADMSPAQVEDMVEQLYRHLARSIVEVFGENPARVRDRVAVPSGWSELEHALAQGKGVILASLHLGNFELCGRVVAEQCRLLDVVKSQRNPFFDGYLNQMRHRHGIATVTVDDAGRATLAHLRRGGVVSLLLDQDAGDKGVPCVFMGQMASTWPGAARLSLQTGCPVLPVCLARTPEGNHQLEFGTVLEPSRLSTGERDAAAYTQRITQELEKFVRRYPEQWFWVHRRWKSGQDMKPPAL